MAQAEITKKVARVLLVVALAAMAVVVVGCSQPAAEKPAMETKPAAAESGEMSGEMAEMTCPMCNQGPPPVEKGTATVEDGVQVVMVSMKDGYYSPNEITIKAGMPAKLVFEGMAKDCSGKPKIKDLDAQVDFTQTGEATMDLGEVAAGTYPITCGMDSPGGNLIVQ